MPRPRQAAAGFAALITVVVFCAADAVARSFPFGPRTRTVNDLGNQYVPFHAHLWDLLHGRADGGLLVNWQSGYGSSFLPDLGTYLTSPFAPLVALFPRDEIDLAVYVITVLKVACAAAAMAWLLLALRPGRWWAAGLLGASYALCGWTVAAAVYNLMWLDGLIALPLLCLVGEWILQRRRPLLGVLVVTAAWLANFYTAYMATLAAALVLLLRLALSGLPPRRKAAVAGRAGLTVALGVGLAAPVVSVIYFGTTHASPGRFTAFKPVGTEDLLARLLPTTYSFGSPALYVGTTALLLALALPFHRAAPRQVRAGWTLLVAAVTLSMQWGPTHLLWHAFAAPQGSPYRQAFVVCALLVMAAWHSLSYGVPAPRALGAAAGLLALLVAVASRSGLVHQIAWPVLLLAVAGAVTGLALLGRATGQGEWRPLRKDGWRSLGDLGTGARRRPALVALAAVLLLATQFGETVATSAVASRLRLAHLDDYAPWGERQQRQAEAVAGADGWPHYRTDPGREQTVANDPMLVGGQGAQYYSSHTSDVLLRTLTALGGGWTSGGRSLQSLDNAVTDAIFSVGARVHSPPDPHQSRYPETGDRVTVSRQDVPPLVTVRPTTTAQPAFGPSPYRNQELLLGARVYTVPRVTVSADTVSARCPAGSEVYLWAPRFWGTATLTGAPGPTGRFRADANRRAAMQRLGTVPPSGRLTIALSAHRPGVIPDGAVGCLDTGALRGVVQRLKATGATKVTVSDGTIRAELPAGSTGTAVLAAPRIAGWRCAAGDAAAEPAGDYHGLVSVPLDGTSADVTCTFRPPGLRLGLTVGGAALLSLLLLAALGAVRRSRPTITVREPSDDRRPTIAKIA
ncbi:YfhO family protein [Streptomyces sp. NBC_00663]|uniref:YfhO family protein n=1 Tax=Streptomyces sp. NBC_00663 TaxID=2975801 RepID=UPI002E317884|nr:YfhO family protein [Streptomyces sp. NBC_00663]